MPGTVSKWLPDDLWERVHPLLPKPQRRRSRYPGRKPLHDRAVLTGIIFVLRTGIPWRETPAELGCGSGMTCLRRLKRWHWNGVFQKLYEVLLAELHGADKLDSKVHVLVDAKGIPLAIQVSGANTHDVTQVIPLVDGVPKVRGKQGRPRQRPDRLQGDRGDDSEPLRDQLRRSGIEPQLAKRRTEHGSGLGKTRWYVERTLAWFTRYGKMRIRTERRAENYEALVKLTACLICHRNL
ncbi:MAG: IS5 family transposase [Nitrospira sp.]|nr:IS5 family transposase [Nitrospira sp.]